MKRIASNETSTQATEPVTKQQKLSSIEITVEIEDDDEYKIQKQQILQQRQLNTTQTTDGKLTNDLLDVVRVSQMTDLDIYFYEDRSPQQQQQQQQQMIISVYNEMKTYLFLKRFISAKLNEKERSDEEKMIYSELYENVIRSYTAFVNENKMIDFIVPMNNTDQDLLNVFMEWTNKHLIQHEKVTVEEFQKSGKGLAASEDIKHDEIIITVPRKLLLCVKTALESETVGSIFTQLKEQLLLDEDTLVTLFIMYEKCNPNTIWKPYFDILPRDLSTYPLYFSASALAILEGTPLFYEIMQTKEQLQEFADSVFPTLFDNFPEIFTPDVFNLENLTWTRAIVDTRAFSFRDMGCCLLPFVDFVNTYPYPQLESKGSYVHEIDAFQIKTMADCKKGEQLFICYGPYSNRELLQCYGFVTENNAYDRYFIDFQLPDDDTEERREQKAQLLAKYNLSLEHFFRYGPIPSKMLATLRICLLDAGQLEEAVNNASWTPFTPSGHEEAVLNALLMTIQALMGMIEDLDDYEMDDSTPLAERFALEYRLSQRRLLQESLEQVNKALASTRVEGI